MSKSYPQKVRKSKKARKSKKVRKSRMGRFPEEVDEAVEV